MNPACVNLCESRITKFPGTSRYAIATMHARLLLSALLLAPRAAWAGRPPERHDDTKHHPHPEHGSESADNEHPAGGPDDLPGPGGYESMDHDYAHPHFMVQHWVGG